MASFDNNSNIEVVANKDPSAVGASIFGFNNPSDGIYPIQIEDTFSSEGFTSFLSYFYGNNPTSGTAILKLQHSDDNVPANFVDIDEDDYTNSEEDGTIDFSTIPTLPDSKAMVSRGYAGKKRYVRVVIDMLGLDSYAEIYFVAFSTKSPLRESPVVDNGQIVIPR